MNRETCNLDCLQSAFSLEVSRVIIPSKRVRKKWRLNERRLGRATVSTRPNPSRRSRPNFKQSAISIEKRERNGLQAGYLKSVFQEKFTWFFVRNSERIGQNFQNEVPMQSSMLCKSDL